MMIFEAYRDTSPLFFSRGICWSISHFHKSVELIYNCGCTKEIIINNNHTELKSKELLVIMPYQQHELPASKKNMSVCVVLPVQYSDMLLNALNHKKPKLNILPPSQTNEKIFELMKKLEFEHNDFALKGIIYTILGLLVDNLEVTNELYKIKNTDFIHTVLQYIDKNYSKNLSLTHLSKTFGYNKYYFSEIFNKFFTTNLNNYINSVRIFKSLDMLNNFSIDEIYHKVGFNGTQQFYLNFKKITGMTPNEYKRQLLL